MSISDSHSKPDLEALLDLLRVDDDGARLAAALNAVRTVPRPLYSSYAPTHQANIWFVLRNSLDRILDFSTLREVIIVAQLSKEYRERAKSYLLRRYNFMLERWVRDPTTFRNLMKDGRSLISGSTALCFALGLGADWDSNDLDVYTPNEESSLGMVKHLVEKEGYQVTPRSFPPTPSDTPALADSLETYIVAESGDFNKISQVHKLTKTISIPGSESTRTLRIDVIQSNSGNSPIVPIFRFHSSIVMNWLSADSVFMAYPRATLQKKGILNLKLLCNESISDQWRDKYAARGFVIADRGRDLQLEGSHPCREMCPMVIRSTLDEACLEFGFADANGGADEGQFAEAQWNLGPGQSILSRTMCTNAGCPRAGVLLGSRKGGKLTLTRAAFVG